VKTVKGDSYAHGSSTYNGPAACCDREQWRVVQQAQRDVLAADLGMPSPKPGSGWGEPDDGSGTGKGNAEDKLRKELRREAGKVKPGREGLRSIRAKIVQKRGKGDGGKASKGGGKK
jgi:hypothetical protein